MKDSKTLKLTELAVLVAIEFVMSFTPLGYLNLGIIAASLLTIPVAIGAVVLGYKESTLLGLIFGCISFYKGFSSTGLMTRAMYAASIPASFVVTVGGRVLMGLCAGLLVQAVRKARKKQDMADVAVGSFGAPILNTIFYMGLLMLLFYHSEYIQNLIATTGVKNPVLLVGTMVGVQAGIEAVTCGILSSLICKALQVTLNRDR